MDERGNVIGIVSAKLDAGAALAASGALPENVNYAIKSREGRHVAVPNLGTPARRPSQSLNRCRRFQPSSKPITADRKFEDVVKSAQDAAVLVLVY